VARTAAWVFIYSEGHRTWIYFSERHVGIYVYPTIMSL